MSEVRDILGRLAVVDVETTGLDPRTAHVLEVGVLFVSPDEAPVQKRWLVRPVGPVPAYITALTGIDEADVSGAPRFGEVAPEIREALEGWTVMAHNATFEQSFLGSVLEQSPMLDSCVLTHLLFPELASHSLDALVRWAGVGTGAQHRALGDAQDTLRVVEVALERVIAAGRRADVEALLTQLTPAESADAQALVGVLARLRDATPATGQPPARVEVCADAKLVRLFARSLEGGGPVALEIERPGALAAALEVAARRRPPDGKDERRRAAKAEAGAESATKAKVKDTADDAPPLVLAVPRRTLRELAPSSPIPIVQRRPTCRVRLAELLRERGADDAARLARAYVSALLARSPLTVPSAWFVERAPDLAALMRAAGPCRTSQHPCGGALAAGESHAVLVSHELALDWLEQRVPMALVVVDAERLPAAERARTSVRMDAERLRRARSLLTDTCRNAAALVRRFDAGAQALAEALAALAGQVGITVDRRARALSPWLRVRDVLKGLQKDVTACLAGLPERERDAALAVLAEDLARLAEPPPPGFDVRLVGGAAPHLVLEPRHPEMAIVARLPRSTALITASRGGLAWAKLPTHHLGPLVRPTVELEPCVASSSAVAAHAGRLALKLAGPVSVLVEGPLEALAEAVRECFPRLPVRTVPGAPPPSGACVTLVRWPGQSPPDALATLVGPVRDVRRAVLACGARDVTVLTPAERWEEVAARLADLLDSGGGLRLGTPPETYDADAP